MLQQRASIRERLMNIDFVASDTSINTGSYRIWICDLTLTLRELGHSVTINSNSKDSSDVIICSKKDSNKVAKFKSKYPNKKIGVINPSASSKTKADFIIVGSVEEACSFSLYKNVFLYPLIERMYNKKFIKSHLDEDEFIVGFHGHGQHLTKFDPYLKNALTALDLECDLRLLIVTSNENFDWKVGKPKVKNIELVKWTFETASKQISRMDVGVVPNTTDLKPSGSIDTSMDLGLYDSDYMLRFKNKSNAGRAFVFMQLGIPVITDLTPSNLHLLGGMDCGYVATDTNGWLKALRELRVSSKRNEIAINAKKKFSELYDCHEWGKRLIKNIEDVKCLNI